MNQLTKSAGEAPSNKSALGANLTQKHATKKQSTGETSGVPAIISPINNTITGADTDEVKQRGEPKGPASGQSTPTVVDHGIVSIEKVDNIETVQTNDVNGVGPSCNDHMDVGPSHDPTTSLGNVDVLKAEEVGTGETLPTVEAAAQPQVAEPTPGANVSTDT